MILNHDNVMKVLKGSMEERLLLINGHLGEGEELVACHEGKAYVASGDALYERSYKVGEGGVKFGGARAVDIAYDEAESDALRYKAYVNMSKRIALGEEVSAQSIAQLSKLNEFVGYEKAVRALNRVSTIESFYNERYEEIRGRLRGRLKAIEDSIKVIKVGRFSDERVEEYRGDIMESWIMLRKRLDEVAQMEFNEIGFNGVEFANDCKRGLAYVREVGSLKELANCLTTLEGRLHKIYLTHEYIHMDSTGE